jgi:hypothetical protein
MGIRILRRIAAMLATALPLVALAAADESPVTGVWQKHDVDLGFAGFTSYYSCDGIEAKLKLLLRSAGARDDVKVRASCSNPYGGPSKLLHAYITFYTLVPAGPERAAPAVPPPPPGHPLGKPAPQLKTAAAPEPGVGAWKVVEWQAKTPLWLELGDCELVETFVHELLPKFTTRDVEARMTCVPHQLTLGGIDVRFKTLAPLPKADAGKAAQPQ